MRGDWPTPRRVKPPAGASRPERTDMSGVNHTGAPAGAGPDEGTQSQPGPSRRSLLRGAAGLAGAGLAAGAVTGAIAGPALASARPARSAPHPEETGDATGVVVHVRDARSGEMDIFSGTSQVRVRDSHLARQLVQAVR
jgi:hypothetical protein